MWAATPGVPTSGRPRTSFGSRGGARADCRGQAQHTGAEPKWTTWQSTSFLDCVVCAKLYRIDADGAQIRVTSDGLIAAPELHIKLKASELMHLLIEQSTQHLGIGTIDRDASKHVVPAVGKGLKPFLLGAVREAINRGLHEVDELECRITRDMRAKEIVQQPQDLPTPESPAMHALGFSLNLVLQSNRLDAISERRVALVFEHSVLAFVSEVFVPGISTQASA